MAQQSEQVGNVFGNPEEARQAKPEAKPKWQLWQVTKAGQTRYCWCSGRDHAFRLVAQADGYLAKNCDAKPVNPVMLTGMLASLSDDQRNAILAQFQPAKKR
jgi:hypothetical protein